MSRLGNVLTCAKIASLSALTFALVAVGVSVVVVNSQIGRTMAGIGSDVHESTVQLNLTTKQVSKSVADTSSMLNANLIHLDLILGRTERLSRKEEAFWDTTSTKTLATLSHADDLIVGLNTTNQNVARSVEDTSHHLNTSMDVVTAGLDKNLTQSQATLVTLNLAALHFDSLLQSPDIIGTLNNIQSTTKNLSGAADHLNYIAADLQGKSTQLLHPSKKKQALNIFMNLLNVSANSGETWYYLRK